MAEQKPRLLAVDDDRDQLDMLHRMLSIYGWEVHTHNSAMGVSNMVSSIAPDIVLLDVNIPALKGDRVIPLARPLAPKSTLFILYSNASPDELRERVLSSGADGFITKSVQGAELDKRLRELIRRGRK
jgi:two-component system, OmpR family, response regulator